MPIITEVWSSWNESWVRRMNLGGRISGPFPHLQNDTSTTGDWWGWRMCWCYVIKNCVVIFISAITCCFYNRLLSPYYNMIFLLFVFHFVHSSQRNFSFSSIVNSCSSQYFVWVAGYICCRTKQRRRRGLVIRDMTHIYVMLNNRSLLAVCMSVCLSVCSLVHSYS